MLMLYAYFHTKRRAPVYARALTHTRSVRITYVCIGLPEGHSLASGESKAII